MWKRVFRPRTLLYVLVLAVIAGVAGTSLAMRNPLKVDIIRDRGSLARESAPGEIENVYRMQLINVDERAHHYTIGVSGLPGLAVVGLEQPIEVKAESTRLVALRLHAPLEARDGAPAPLPGVHAIELTIRSLAEPEHDGADRRGEDHETGREVTRHEHSTFIIPR